MWIWNRWLRRMEFRAPPNEGQGGGEGGGGGGDGGTQTQPDPTTPEGFGLGGNEPDPLDDDLNVILDGLSTVQAQQAQQAEQQLQQQTTMTPEQQQAESQAMLRQLQQNVGNLKLADDLFGADFDPTNPQQLRETMTKAVQFAVMQAVGMSMFPMSKALEANHRSIEGRLAMMMKEHLGGNNESLRLQEEFPLIDDPNYGSLFKEMDSTLRKAKKPYGERLRALKGLATRLGVQPKTSQRGGSGGSGGMGDMGGLLTGSDALDALFE